MRAESRKERAINGFLITKKRNEGFLFFLFDKDAALERAIQLTKPLELMYGTILRIGEGDKERSHQLAFKIALETVEW